MNILQYVGEYFATKYLEVLNEPGAKMATELYLNMSNIQITIFPGLVLRSVETSDQIFGEKLLAVS
jgi:hypothetical protein